MTSRVTACIVEVIIRKQEGYRLPILGLDIDDTSGKYLKSLMQDIIEQEQGKRFAGLSAEEIITHFPDMQRYDSFEWAAINGNRELFKEYHRIAVENGIYTKLEPFEGVSEALWKLKREHDYRIFVITSRFVIPGQHARVVSDTALWLDKHDIPYDDIMFTSEKVNVLADVYIDDSPKNITSLQEAGRKTIVYDRSYNRDLTGPRAHNWNEAYDLLSTMFK